MCCFFLDVLLSTLRTIRFNNMSWILIGMIQKSSFNLYKKTATNTMFLLLSWCSITLDFQSQSLLQLGRCPPEWYHVKWFLLKKRGEKKQPYFPKQPSGRTALNVSIHLHPISHSGLHSTVTTSLRIDHTCRSWNILTGPMSSLPPNSLRDWFHFSIQHPLPLPEAFASFLHSLLSFAIHISCALGNCLFAYFLN